MTRGGSSTARSGTPSAPSASRPAGAPAAPGCSWPARRSAPGTGRSLDSALPAGPVRVTEAALVELAVRVAGQFVDVVDGPRDLEPGHPPIEEGEQLGGQVWLGGEPGGRLDDGLDLLSPFLVRDPEHRYVRPRGMARELGLDLRL